MTPSTLPCVFISEDYPQWALSMLRSELVDYEVVQGSVIDLLESVTASRVEALLVRSTSRVDHNLLTALPRLKIVGTATSGFDHLDLDVLSQKSIMTFHTPDANAAATADLTLWHILSVLRNLKSQTLNALKWRPELPRGHNAENLSLGILGMGRIGKHVARRAQALGMSLFYHDPYIDHEELQSSFLNLNAQPMGLLELFTHCDVITLHLPLTRKTHHIINEKTLEHFGHDKILVNCARGELVHTQAVLKALDSGILTSVALDTFEVEPLEPSSPLRQHPRVYWTPHIGAYTEEAFHQSCQEAIQTVIDFLNFQKSPPAPLPPAAAWVEDL